MKEICVKLNKIGADSASAIERFMNDEDFYLKYVTEFPEEPTMASLVAAVDAKDYAQAQSAVHTLKGITKNLGFNPLADATVDMLDELRDGNTAVALKEYEVVKKQYAIFCDLIRAER